MASISRRPSPPGGTRPAAGFLRRRRDLGLRVRGGSSPRGRRPRGPAGLFSPRTPRDHRRRRRDHVLGRQIVPQPEIDRLPQVALRGPLGELHAGDQLRADPVWFFVGRRRRQERRRRRCARFEEAPDPRQLLVAEAAADVARVAQAALAGGKAQQQRAEPGARAARFGVAAHDQILFFDQLELSPILGPAPRPIDRARVLGDDPLPAPRPRLVHQRRAVALLPRDPDRAAVADARQRRLQPAPPLGERQPAQIVATVAQEIEGHERHRLGGGQPRHVLGRGQVNALLQVLEPQRITLRIERHDLAVEEHLGLAPPPPIFEGRRHLRELRGLVVAEARRDGHLDAARARCDRDQRADAVVLPARKQGLDRGSGASARVASIGCMRSSGRSQRWRGVEAAGRRGRACHGGKDPLEVHRLAGPNSELRREAAADLEDVLRRRADQAFGLGLGRRVLDHAHDAAIGADEDHVQRDERVLHPEALDLRLVEDEDHPGVGRQPRAVHEPAGVLLGRQRHLDPKHDLALCRLDRDVRGRAGGRRGRRRLLPVALAGGQRDERAGRGQPDQAQSDPPFHAPHGINRWSDGALPLADWSGPRDPSGRTGRQACDRVALRPAPPVIWRLLRPSR